MKTTETKYLITDDVTINIVELASELAHMKLINEWNESIKIYMKMRKLL